MSRCATVLSSVLILVAVGCGAGGRRPGRYLSPDALPEEWLTLAERSDYARTDRYEDVVAFCRRLADFAPEAHYTTFGTSGEGRPLPLLVLSREQAFSPARARASRRPLVLIQNCIHAGECAGKDASLALARDILVTGEQAGLLEGANLLIMPIFNVDGHERFGPYHRINQDGPEEMGWRVTACNLNLNRDYTKADAVEMQHWLRCWTAWRPDLFIDDHTTDGSDHQYDLLYTFTAGPGISPEVSAWMAESLMPTVLEGMEREGFGTFPYSWPRDPSDLGAGIEAAVGFSPRYSTGYGAICNRPTILVEVHALKPYARRVKATYAFLCQVLETIGRNPAALRRATRTADEACARRRGAGPDGLAALRWERTDQAEEIAYRGIEARVDTSDITGGPVVSYTGQPVTARTRLYRQARIAASVTPPAAYLVPPQWTHAIDRLTWHGIAFFRLKKTQTLPVVQYRLEDVAFPRRPFEGRFQPRYRVATEPAEKTFPAGTVVVPLDQPRALAAIHLLEPEAPDSLVAWGFFNAIFEQKEYAETYAMEPLARRMLSADPKLAEEFKQRLNTDPDFAKDPRARLMFFYRRSPYWDQALNLYPVARLEDRHLLNRLR